MGLSMPIPKAMREQLADDPFMTDCIIAAGCSGRIEWHHAFNYAGKRQNELWAILPLCKFHHSKAGTSAINTICKMTMRMRIQHFKDMSFATKYPRSDFLKELITQSI